jgi:RHS repeat-associated protein
MKSIIWMPVLLIGAMLAPAMATAKETIYYLHNDHLGTPQAMSDQSGTVVWKAEYEPFGTVVVDEDPDGDGIAVTCNLRFPGQYFDAETGLHYNYHRDYDPETGRYVEADPVGIERGGNHSYIYAHGNTSRWDDPSGLLVKLCMRDIDVIGLPTQFIAPELHHTFISVLDQTFGLNYGERRTYGFPFGGYSTRCGIEGPGQIQQNYSQDVTAEAFGWMHGRCRQVCCPNEYTLLEGLMKEAFSPPYYCLSPGVLGFAMNCQQWALTMLGKYCR